MSMMSKIKNDFKGFWEHSELYYKKKYENQLVRNNRLASDNRGIYHQMKAALKEKDDIIAKKDSEIKDLYELIKELKKEKKNEK